MFSNPNNSTVYKTVQHNLQKNTNQNLWFWLPILFACGQILFISYQSWFNNYQTQYYWHFIACLSILFFLCCISYKINRLLFFLCLFIVFLLSGIIYCQFYHYKFLAYQKIDGLAFTNVTGKIIAIKPSSNNKKSNIIIENPLITQYQHSAKTPKKIHKKNLAKKHKNTKKLTKKSKHNKKPHQKTQKNLGKYPFTQKNIINNFINVKNYQDIDREFLDKNKKLANLTWHNKILINPPPFVSINITAQNLKINDFITINAMFNAQSKPDLPNSFDWQKYNLAQKIGGYAISIGETTIIKKAQISNAKQYILNIRENINFKIKTHIHNPDISAVASALLIGNQEQINKSILQNIRNCGLSHLLSISGFHLGLVATMFFCLSRFILACNQFIAIRYNIKKISAFIAIFTSYIYLNLADSPLPAQRAFIVVAIVMLSYIINEKFNSKRAIFLAFLLLILLNPYSLYNLSFQLSFLAIAVLGFYYSNLKPLIFKPDTTIKNSNLKFWQACYRFLYNFWQYFIDIVIISWLITIFSLPIIMNSVQNFAILGFVANIFAIPLASFMIMPLGVLALIFMPFGLEKIVLAAMAKSIEIFLSIANYIGNFKIHNIPIAFTTTPYLPSFALLISLFGFLLFIIHQNKYLKILAILIFCGSISVAFWQKPPNIVFLHNQKLALFYQEKSSELFFFGKFNNLIQQQNILQKFNVKQATELPKCNQNSLPKICWQECNKNNCLFRLPNFNILLLKKSRHHLPTLCQKIITQKINLVVNFSKKYDLPILKNQQLSYCLKASNVWQIDNLDFLNKGTHTIFYPK